MIPSPMKTQWFQILLAVAGGPLHGYAIQRAVLEQTQEGMRLWPAMLYRSLATLEEESLITSVPPPEDEPNDERRQYWALTTQGRERLRQESELLARWARAAQSELS